MKPVWYENAITLTLISRIPLSWNPKLYYRNEILLFLRYYEIKILYHFKFDFQKDF
jgi:hypothetical protein